jgi:outer membrane protein assembly factor BamD (BamD/ComL family)
MNPAKTLIVLSVVMIMGIACSSKLSEAEYYKMATEAFNKEDYETSIKNFEYIIKYYPEGERASEALFMLGYINANNTMDLKKAEKYYKEFIEKYPDDELTDDAQYELKNLGKSVDELPIFQDAPEDSVSN